MCLASTIKSISPNQPIKVFFGLKRSQWKQKNFYQQKVRNYLEGMGANVAEVRCYKKTTADTKPRADPNFINLFLRVNGQNLFDVF